MLPIKKILCPTDFSEPSREAVKVAGELAAHFRAGLVLVHVVPALPALPNDPNYVFNIPEYERLLHKDAEEKMGRLAGAGALEGTTARTIFSHGDAASEIVRIAEVENSDLIVIATRGTTGWQRLLFGSVAEKVVRLAGCPVLTIRNPLENGA